MMQKPLPETLRQGGLILVDKPLRWTSFDVINRLRRLLNVKIGHAGTLDPLASGLLICCTGSWTKKITDYQRQPKEYTGIIHLGAVTSTYDLESEPEDFRPYEHLTEQDIHNAAAQFTGDILQVPPVHSAIKKGGKRAYEMARKGAEVILDPRPVSIAAFDIVQIRLPEVHFRVACSTGTYIRSLAHDFGQAVGCGAYLQELRRTKIGEFDVADAWSPEQWMSYWKAHEGGDSK
jgi:tRNA pseudouridine55 synthase